VGDISYSNYDSLAQHQSQSLFSFFQIQSTAGQKKTHQLPLGVDLACFAISRKDLGLRLFFIIK
jgi:hypothetical protein